MARFIIFCMQIAVLAAAGPVQRVPSPPVEKLAEGIRVAVGDGFLAVQPKSDTIVRVVFSKDRDPRVDDMVVVGPGNSLAARPPSPKASR